MFKRKILLVLTAIGIIATTSFAQVAIDETNFPDDNFRNWIETQTYGTDGKLTDTEIAAVMVISVSSNQISDLTGIEHFTALTTLYCSDNQLSELNVSNNPALKNLYCDTNQLTELNVSELTNLEVLICHNNQLTELDVSELTNLGYLYCDNNQLTELDVSGLNKFWHLNCSGNQLTELDVSGLSNLEYLDCSGNQLTELDVSGLNKFWHLNCSGNQLTELDVSNNTALMELYCQLNAMSGEDKVIGLDKTVTRVFIFSPQKINIASAEISLEYNTTVYNGAAQEPAIIGPVMLGETELIEDSDYTIDYSDNTNAGTASVEVMGIGTYGGTVKKTFTITPKALANAMILPIARQNHTGAAIEPTVTVKDGEITLVKDTDYSLAYSSNTAIGTASVTVTGIGNYTAIATTSFEIVKGTTAIIDNNNSANKPIFKSTIVSTQMEIILNDYRNISFVVYDMTGNIVADGSGRTWNLRNTAGRLVANGSYLVIVEAKDTGGQQHRYSAKLGVKR